MMRFRHIRLFLVIGTIAISTALAQRAELPTGFSPDHTCNDCHADLITKRSVHSVIAEDGCETCHEETSAHVFEPPETASESCLMCHEDDERNWSHADGAAECLDCHDPHGSQHLRQLLLPPNQLCQDCHELGLETTGSAHAPVTKGRCLDCHHPHSVGQKPLLRTQISETCVKCHRSILKPKTGAPGIHVRIDDGNGCTKCHDPHESPHRKLLKVPFAGTGHVTQLKQDVALCFTCHQESMLKSATSTMFRTQDGRSLHRIHLDAPGLGRSCRACHTMHLPGETHLVGRGFPMGSWFAPIEYVAQGSLATCFSACHEPRSYPIRAPRDQTKD